MKKSILSSTLLIILFTALAANAEKVPVWDRLELQFTSQQQYENALYDIKEFSVRFESPSGRLKKIYGFWDGETSWKVRFMPDELGRWSWKSFCSDKDNKGLDGISGKFDCISNKNELEIYSKGALIQPAGTYHIAYSDGTPFFWTACTAWNGALLSTEQEWEKYLSHRARNGYNTIQFVTTQWRGADKNSEGETAFTGCGRISVNTSFYQALDKKVDRINAHGLIAAPVLLWALPVGDGRHLSPGYTLPVNEAVLLARYMVARYGAHHVVWILGGDGFYSDSNNQRWLEIGRRVFGEDHPGLVSQHPSGRQWIGDNHKDADWLDIVGYQSSHSNKKGTVDWLNKGPMAKRWNKLRARPLVNMEPNYEEIRFQITAEDVRNASYWSMFATPIAGITYGANGIWPWIREGDRILNHWDPGGVSAWDVSMEFPGSIQIGYLADFFRTLPWWDLRPCQELLVTQPGDSVFNHFIGISKTPDSGLLLAYLPVQTEVQIYNPSHIDYSGEWFDPKKNESSKAKLFNKDGIIKATSPRDQDMLLLLKEKK